MTTVRVIKIPHIPGRPELSNDEPPVGARGLELMSMLVRASALLQGVDELRVERSVVRVLRKADRPQDDG